MKCPFCFAPAPLLSDRFAKRVFHNDVQMGGDQIGFSRIYPFLSPIDIMLITL
jgi:hypothetical protein